MKDQVRSKQVRANNGLLGQSDEYNIRDRHQARVRQSSQDQNHEAMRGGRQSREPGAGRSKQSPIGNQGRRQTQSALEAQTGPLAAAPGHSGHQGAADARSGGYMVKD